MEMCEYNVIMGASPTEYLSMSSLINSINAHSKAIFICVTLFSNFIHSIENIVTCLQPKMKNIQLSFQLFDERNFIPDIRSDASGFRIELLDPYNWFRFTK